MTLFLEMRFCLCKGYKSLFVHLFWSETKVSIVEGPMTLVHFIDWVGTKFFEAFCFFWFLL